MKVGDLRTEIEAIDGELLRLLERRSRLVGGTPPGACDPASAHTAEAVVVRRHARPTTAAALYARLSHPEAHVQLGDLP